MEFVRLTPEQEKARRRRNWVIALALLGFMTLVFFITLARVGAGLA